MYGKFCGYKSLQEKARLKLNKPLNIFGQIVKVFQAAGVQRAETRRGTK